MRIDLPGLFDLQVNGFRGVDFNNPAATRDQVFSALEAIVATGVTRCLPTLISSSLEHFAQCANTIISADHAAFAGFHMEGPYVSPADGPRGVHPLASMRAASVEDFDRRQDATEGNIRLVTLAPEVPGAMVLIEYLVRRGVRVAIGHTAATPQQIRDAVHAGATLSTHLGNGCQMEMPRHPNLIWEQLAHDQLEASLIVDGHHLPPATVKGMIRAKQPSRIILITDAMSAAGCGPGNYELNGEPVVVTADGRATPVGKPWLAGSTLTLDQAVVNTVKLTGLPLEIVWQMAANHPAEYLGLSPVGRVVADWDENYYRLSNLQVTQGKAA